MGRGLRSSPSTGKADCLLLDFSGNIVRMADDFADIYYNGLDALDSGEKLDKVIRRDNEEQPEGKACPQCGYKPCGKRCVACGFEHQSRSEIEHEAGEMHGDSHRQDQVCRRQAAPVGAGMHLHARGHSIPEKQRGRAKNIYRDIAGVWPPSEWSFDATPSVPITRAVLNKIRQKNIAYAKALAA